MTFTKEQIKQVADLTNFNLAKSEKLLKGVYNDINEDGIETTFEDVLEVIDMELKSKSNFKNYVSDTTKERTKTERVKKVDEDKEYLMRLILSGTFAEFDIETPTDSKVSFEYNGNAYTITLTKHRAKK